MTISPTKSKLGDDMPLTPPAGTAISKLGEMALTLTRGEESGDWEERDDTVMYVCMYVCMPVCLCVYKRIFSHKCAHTYIPTRAHACIHVCIK